MDITGVDPPMSWVCMMCDEIVYDCAWPWGNATVCNECYNELTDVRLDETLDEWIEKNVLEEEE